MYRICCEEKVDDKSLEGLGLEFENLKKRVLNFCVVCPLMFDFKMLFSGELLSIVFFDFFFFFFVFTASDTTQLSVLSLQKKQIVHVEASRSEWVAVTPHIESRGTVRP